jgi:hypothetical protein
MRRSWALPLVLGVALAAACGGKAFKDGAPASGAGGSAGAGGDGGRTGTGAAPTGPVPAGPAGPNPAGCTTDADCPKGVAWCEGGACVPCDNGGLACDIACIGGWSTYERNGCFPCECAPINQCTRDAECGAGQKCYAGKLCWSWCPPADASCCYGNRCSAVGCPDPNPAGCLITGCPQGQSCVTDPRFGCAPSGCACAGGGWGCTADCSGGICLSPV